MDLVRLASSRLTGWLELLLMADTKKLNAWNQVGEPHANDPDGTTDRSITQAKTMGTVLACDTKLDVACSLTKTCYM